MAQALSSMRPNRNLPAADTATDALIRSMTNRLEDGSDWRRRALPSRLAPTEAERGILAERVSVIDRWLSPARRAAIIRAVELCRSALAIANNASDDIIEVYVQVLAPYPEPVVESICHRFMIGTLGNRVYAPTPAEIAHECRLAVAEALAERGRIALILDAEVYETPSPEDQARIQEMHADFVRETAQRAQVARERAPEPLPSTRDPNLAADLEARRIRREAEEAAAQAGAGAMDNEAEARS